MSLVDEIEGDEVVVFNIRRHWSAYIIPGCFFIFFLYALFTNKVEFDLKILGVLILIALILINYLFAELLITDKYCYLKNIFNFWEIDKVALKSIVAVNEMSYLSLDLWLSNIKIEYNNKKFIGISSISDSDSERVIKYLTKTIDKGAN